MMPDAALDLLRPASDGGAAERLRLGFMPLVDCAPLVIARDLGFAAAEGLDLDLVRETSWANIRDRVVLGHFDAAHMLAPMPIAARLGLGHILSPLVTPFVLNHGGNSVALTRAFDDELGPHAFDDPVATGRGFARAIAARAAAGREPPTIAIVHPFSCHNYQVRYWLAAAGIDPDRDVRLVVVPPPYMVDAMHDGLVDGVCVGAPWPGLAVDAEVGRLTLTSGAIWPASPEKVLGLRESLLERRPAAVAALIRALDRAAAWCASPENLPELAERLARPDIVGVAAAVILRSLSGRLATGREPAPVEVDGFLRFHGDGPAGPINRPRRVDARWLAAQMLRWGHAEAADHAFAAADAACRADVYDAALGLAAPPSDGGRLTPFDGAVFDAERPSAGLAPRPLSPTATGD